MADQQVLCSNPCFSKIEILPAGETGPRRLDGPATMKIQGIPFLSISEFVRAKLKTWITSVLLSFSFRVKSSYLLCNESRSQQEQDALDICFCMARYWNRIDINRIQEHDMREFVRYFPVAAPAWGALQRKYGLEL